MGQSIPQPARGFQAGVRWPLVRMNEIATLHYGKALTASDRRPGSVRVYGSNGQCGWHDMPLGAGPTVILGRKGQGPLGDEWCPWPFWVIDTAYYVTVDISRVYLRYFYFLTKFIGLNHLKDGTSNPSLSRDVFGQQGIPLPPRPIQRRIASILSAYDDLIENSQRRIKILESMARGLYREWFVHFRFPGHENHPRVPSPLGEIPKGWEVQLLGDILELHYGKALKKDERRDGPFPVFGSSGIVGTHDTRLVKGPGIVVGRKGNVGSVFWSDEDFFVIDTAFYVTSSLPLRFLFYVLPTLNFINSDAAVPGLSRNQAYALKILVPPMSTLATFCNLANIFESQAATLLCQIQNLRRTRDLLLPRLLAGKVDLKEV